MDDTELADLQARAAAGDSAAAALEKAQETIGQLQPAAARADAATAALLDTTRAANPTIPAELIAGDTPEAITASLATATATVAKVRELNPAPTASTVPGTGAGAPPRTNEPPAGLRGVTRITYALNHPGPGNTE